jgi:hypothetical protein
MTDQNGHYQELVKLLFPSELFDYFEITKMVVDDRFSNFLKGLFGQLPH